jgi:N-acetylneuraminic acid mutarotase
MTRFLSLYFVLLACGLPLFSQTQALDLAERTARQRAVEEVYWQHRIWPKENPGAKPALAAMISQQQLQARTENSLRLTNAIAKYWHLSISGAQLQSEMNRIAQDSKQPDVLRELFAALDNDPRLVAEILARPALAERLARSFYQKDQRFSSKALPFERWWSKESSKFSAQVPDTAFAYTLPNISAVNAAPDSWSPTHDLPSGDNGMTAVWTGAEMIVWGGGPTLSPVYNGARYDPATDTWHSTNNSSVLYGKTGHTAVWTGTEMIIWGGCDLLRDQHHCDNATGQRYNPLTDSWIGTSLSGVPHTRMNHTAVWTGTEMIVWGGCSFINDVCLPSQVGSGGGRYNPSTDTWILTSLTNAPSARQAHTMVWTGSQAIVWGGASDTAPLNTGALYKPSTDTWTATAAVPAGLARYFHTAVWSGTEMLMWGGQNTISAFNNGARYNPATNKWKAIPIGGAPSARSLHTAVWSGNEMVVWGGVNGLSSTNTGGRFNPATNTWKATSTVNAPVGRSGRPVSVWTGSTMIVWGGFDKTGGRYDLASDSWTPTNAVVTASGRESHTAVWTGTEMIVWGGDDAFTVGGTNTGARYNLALDTWTPTTTIGGPSGRHLHTAVWTGTEMIIWGGDSGNVAFKNGGRYNPVTDSWTKTNVLGAPAARAVHSAVWTGTEMIIFGGSGLTSPWLNTGGRYNPSTDSWKTTSTVGAPSPRELNAAVWTGTEMIVWGGGTATFDTNTGARYNPATDSWKTISTTNAPSARDWTAYAWTGSKMLIWGGQTFDGTYTYHNDGGLYDPATDKWTSTSLSGAPTGRGWFGYVWTGTDLIAWGGCGLNAGFCSGSVFTGGRYNPATDLWTPISTTSAPAARHQFPAVWTGSQMIVWGGGDWTGFFLATTGGVYTPGP